ncbi:MAG: hypothetical protein LBJ90_03130 [Treponema sp.]|nr:hypothetical protein [Treponema sp.]
MKKIVFVSVLFISFAAVSPLFAQKISKEHESEYYVNTVFLEKVYPYQVGYVLQYRKGINQMARLYIPYEWFTEAAGRAELVTLPPGANWPYLTVFYKDGEFSHIRLYLHRSKAHETWGNVPLGVNINDRFEGVDSIKLEF